MPQTWEERKAYIAKWKREARRKRGLKPPAGPKPYTPEQKEEARLKKAEYDKEWNKLNRDKNIGTYLFYAAKKRAKEKSMEFNIEKDDIVIPEKCPYLNIPFQLTERRKGSDRTAWPSLDRIDNNKGYVKGNIEVISHLANTMKSKATKEMLLSFAEEIKRKFDDS